MIEETEIVDVDLSNQGTVLPPKNSNIALIDADTILFGACSVHEYEEELLEQSFYTEQEWKDLTEEPGFYIREDGGASIKGINLDEAYQHSMDKINMIMDETGCKDFELHFTAGRKSFRYLKVDPQYKANRVGMVGVYGLYDLKKLFVEKEPTKSFIWYEWEADDMVVSLRRDFPEKYMLCAVDKDVLYTIEGRHFNYYSSVKYNIKMKFIDVDEFTAVRWHYVQTITGDAGDGIIGIKGLGKVKANKALGSTLNLIDLWNSVIKSYEKAGRSEVEAINNMRLVSMHQLVQNNRAQKYEVKLWRPAT